MKKCEQCGRVDSDLGTCGSTTTCPMILGQPAAEVTPKDIVLHCEPCGVARAVPVANIIGNKIKPMDALCQRGVDNCQCVVITQEPAKGKATNAKAASPKAG